MPVAKRKPKPRKPPSVSDAILKALVDDFTRNGPSAIERVRDKTPDKYLALMATLLPKVAHVPEAAAAISASPAFGPISQTARWITEKLAEDAVDTSAESGTG